MPSLREETAVNTNNAIRSTKGVNANHNGNILFLSSFSFIYIKNILLQKYEYYLEYANYSV